MTVHCNSLALIAASEASSRDGASIYRPSRWSPGSVVLTLSVQALPLVIGLWVWQPALVQVAPAQSVAAFDVAPEVEPAVEPVSEPRSAAEPAKPVTTEAAPATADSPAWSEPAPAAPTLKHAASSRPTPATAAAPPAVAARPKSDGEQSADWHARVLGRLNAVKAYPSSARSRRQQGVVMIRFVIDRTARVLRVALAQSSGFALLDREALALPKRAIPLPAPPEEVKGAEIELVVPVEFLI